MCVTLWSNTSPWCYHITKTAGVLQSSQDKTLNIYYMIAEASLSSLQEVKQTLLQISYFSAFTAFCYAVPFCKLVIDHWSLIIEVLHKAVYLQINSQQKLTADRWQSQSNEQLFFSITYSSKECFNSGYNTEKSASAILQHSLSNFYYLCTACFGWMASNRNSLNSVLQLTVMYVLGFHQGHTVTQWFQVYLKNF